MRKSIVYISLLLTLFMTFGCKKSESLEPLSQTELELMDMTYLYGLYLSLWTEKLPQPEPLANGDPNLRKYTEKFRSAEEVLESLKVRTQFDRFSFIDRGGRVSEEIQEGVHVETGAMPIYLRSGNNGNLFIKLVQKGSPAEAAGLKRGMQVISINGNTKMDYRTDSLQGFSNFYKFYSGENLTLVVKPEGQTQTRTINLRGAPYKLNPILTSKVVESTAGKVGYFAYTSFIAVQDTAGKKTEYYYALENMFTDFQSQGIKELVVDLRYNGGGAVNTAEFLANMLVPVAHGKAKMYEYKVNKYLVGEGLTKEGKAFGPTNFNKTNTLNLERIYFLATKSTASASELLMNSLAPYMDVQIITINNEGTYGKPVGFFPVTEEKSKADIYITSFQMINNDGYGDYFTGLKGQKTDSKDGYSKELGDPTEQMFADALYSINNGGRYQSAKASASRAATTGGASRESIGSPKTNTYRDNMYKFSKSSLLNLQLPN
ncbi:S41 family peptidase [Sphingobacterium lactis]|uniref:S41 family peptidase n=1 Tax=Sphingobacterium lactis TaxID=797291 RepID=UPI003EC78157